MSLGARAAAHAASAAEAQRWQRVQRAGRRWAAWGVALGLALGTAVNAPAQWLGDALQQASDGRFMLAEARGSLWNGSAVLVLTGGADSRDASALPGRLQWRLRPDWRGLQLQARQACCLNGDLKFHFQPAWRGFTLSLGDTPGVSGSMPAPAQTPAPDPSLATVIGQWPAAWLSGLGTPWNTLQLGGLLQLASPGMQLQSVHGQLRLDGRLDLELHEVSSRVSTLPSLGSYRLSVQGRGAVSDQAALQLSTLSGALRLSGSGQWTGSKLRFRGQAQAAPDQAAALSNLLNIIGQRQGALSVISIG